MIDLTQKITCNGQPVEVLKVLPSGWTDTEIKYCLVGVAGRVCMMALNGTVYDGWPQLRQATNTAPAPNLVGKDDEVMWDSRLWEVKGIDGELLWIRSKTHNERESVHYEHCRLNGRPIEGVKP